MSEIVKKYFRSLRRILPDKAYIKLKYYYRFHKSCNLVDPHTFNEKLQWLKLYDRNPIYTQLVDKYEVRQYITEKNGDEYLIPIVGGPWNSVDEIDYNSLPEQFVLKCTHDSGGLIICREKDKLDKEMTKAKLNKCLKKNYYWQGREWPYKNIKPKIIAEKYLEDATTLAHGLTDFKFFCFNSTPKMMYISKVLEDHKTACISLFYFNGKQMPFKRSDFKSLNDEAYALPENYEEMLYIVTRLAKYIDCRFVRIDLYSIRGDVYFSEITFFPVAALYPLNHHIMI